MNELLKTPPPLLERRFFDIVAAVLYLQSLGLLTASTSLIRKLIASRKISFLRCGRKFHISKSSLDLWLEKELRKGR